MTPRPVTFAEYVELQRDSAEIYPRFPEVGFPASDNSKRALAAKWLPRVRQFCPHVAEIDSPLALSWTAAIDLPKALREYLATGAAGEVEQSTPTKPRTNFQSPANVERARLREQARVDQAQTRLHRAERTAKD
ncbi:MAG: hypothetical protein H7Y38_16060 [Armatimonadetes bacterium]|nr:hypothetical protein [Armatimonadota bacterium]